MAQNDRSHFDFTGNVVIVTGGTRGIGLAIARAFSRSGADVIVCGRHAPSDGTAGTDAVFFEADVRDPEQAQQLIGEAVSRFGRLDVLVNNAGGSPAVPAAEASPRFVKSVVELNLLAPFFCSQAANAVMQEQDSGGSIVNIGSVSGTRPSPGSAAYGAAKAGLANLTTTLAVEWAPRVRVNCLVGGLIATEQAEGHYGGPDGLAAVAATVPLGRMGTPEDIAGLCLVLASPVTSYVSGAVLVANGGGERPAYLTALEEHLGPN
jgi:NAD(P)-dependent dehydrogenase (short-subunit alcohol dehydrogenase family)